MATTTVDGFRSAVNAIVLGLACTGKPFGQPKYRKAAVGADWDERPLTDVDRAFSIIDFRRGEIQYFGSTSQTDYRVPFVLRIGHAVRGTDKETSIIRRDTDVFQIIAALENPSNQPTACGIIIYRNTTITELADRYLTDIELEAQITMAL